jgi:hypothetical protein
MAAGQRHEHVLEGAVTDDHLGCGQRPDQIGRHALRDDTSVIDDRDTVAQELGFVHVVRRQQDGAAVATERPQRLPQLAARLRVQTRGRLVEKQQLRTAGKRAGQREPLFLPAGQFAGAAGALRLQLDDLQQRIDGRTAVVEGSEQPERLLDRQLVRKLRFLKLDAKPLPQFSLVGAPAHSQHFDLTGVGRDEPLENLDSRRLAGAVRPEQAEAFAALDGQREVADCHDFPVRLSERMTLDGQVGHSAIVA